MWRSKASDPLIYTGGNFFSTVTEVGSECAEAYDERLGTARH